MVPVRITFGKDDEQFVGFKFGRNARHVDHGEVAPAQFFSRLVVPPAVVRLLAVPVAHLSAAEAEQFTFLAEFTAVHTFYQLCHSSILSGVRIV